MFPFPPDSCVIAWGSGRAFKELREMWRPEVLDLIMPKPHIFSPGKEEKLMQMGHLVQLTHLKRADVKWLLQDHSAS